MKTPQHIRIEGYVSAGFEAVRDAFAENFSRRHELGGACCVYHRGEKVVDLWGGLRNEATGEPWEEHTMVVVYSTTKGISALTMALAHARGLYDYDARVARYWPEFAQAGKEGITVRQLMAHQAGLYAFDELADRSIIADPDRLAAVLARQKPAHAPGTRQFYHAVSLGYYESELLRRVDPHHRTLGRYFQDEIATPLGLEFYIRLPEDIPNARLATPRPAKGAVSAIFKLPFAFFLAVINPRSAIHRALAGSELAHDAERIYARNLEIPAGGGVGTARAIARAYSVFATGGKELGVDAETLRQLMAPAVAPHNDFHDGALKVEIAYSLGFIKPTAQNPFGSPDAFGTPGFGGSFGYADPRTQIAYGYVTNGMGGYLTDPRDIALRAALRRALGGKAA